MGMMLDVDMHLMIMEFGRSVALEQRSCELIFRIAACSMCKRGTRRCTETVQHIHPPSKFLMRTHLRATSS